MGMAASQARYLALSARKTNVEYEGQQINQQRLVLSNQSADLFNQMLTMSVPMPPSSADFTKLQYSWNDGNTASVIDNYYQIGTIDDEFNYVVSSYHYENVYTGQRKFLSDPQVQATKTNHFEDPKTKNYTVQEISYNLEKDTYTFKMTNNFDQQIIAEYKRSNESEKVDIVEELDALYASDRIARVDKTAPTDAEYIISDDGNTITYKSVQYTKVDKDNKDQLTNLMKSYGAKYDSSKEYFYNATDKTYICKDEIDNLKLTNTGEVVVRKQDLRDYYTDGTRFAKAEDIKNIDTQSPTQNILSTVYTINNPTFSDYTAVGNSKLKLLSEEDYKNDPTIDIAIQQIMKDMKSDDGTMIAYEHLKKCFDENGLYQGGLYQFKVADKTYYTTADDLDDSLRSAYDKQSVAENSIDSQQAKLSYYNAVYINTKISEIKKALMETDGQGRFSTVKFEDDSTVYTLNVETIKDEDAYNDAMNKYFYDKEQYDKQVADINSKTEIIQAQDRQLQLKLEQLNTEQSALQTEMEACQKVVSKNIENSFKTFSG